jgi:hypothetical protein
MFCHYCGKPNPDEASFCNACGKNIAWTPGSAATVNAAPVTPPETPPPVAEIAAPPLTHAVTPAPATEAKTDRWQFHPAWGVLAGIAVIVMVLPHKDGPSICDAMRNEVRQQIPFSVDILAARHPLTVGVLRSITKDSQLVDQMATFYVEQQMIGKTPGLSDCYISYYAVMFQKDSFRAAIADWMDARFKANF